MSQLVGNHWYSHASRYKAPRSTHHSPSNQGSVALYVGQQVAKTLQSYAADITHFFPAGVAIRSQVDGVLHRVAAAVVEQFDVGELWTISFLSGVSMS
ncbi:hypothetical protein HBI57_253500 [Parastagonospora nodorum]|nr:hypothetical protein HBI57_253500 [Parastagonospora nodorum]